MIHTLLNGINIFAIAVIFTLYVVGLVWNQDRSWHNISMISMYCLMLFVAINVLHTGDERNNLVTGLIFNIGVQRSLLLIAIALTLFTLSAISRCATNGDRRIVNNDISHNFLDLRQDADQAQLKIVAIATKLADLEKRSIISSDTRLSKLHHAASELQDAMQALHKNFTDQSHAVNKRIDEQEQCLVLLCKDAQRLTDELARLANILTQMKSSDKISDNVNDFEFISHRT